MNTTTGAQRHNARQDKIWERAKHAQTRFNASSRHSPLPWEIGDSVENPRDMAPFTAIVNKYGIAYAFGETKEQREANAKLIVRSVNNAEKLAEALRDCLRWIGSLPYGSTDGAYTSAKAKLAEYEKETQ